MTNIKASRYNSVQSVVMLFSAIWMIGISARFVLLEILFHGETLKYHLSSHDLFFDWIPMLFLGSFLLSFGVIKWLDWCVEKNKPELDYILTMMKLDSYYLECVIKGMQLIDKWRFETDVSAFFDRMEEKVK